MNAKKYSALLRKILDNSPRQTWATIQRKLSSQPRLESFDESHPAIFVLSTGRVGTETTAALLRCTKNVLVYHEPSPRLFALSSLAYAAAPEESASQILLESWKAARNERIGHALSCGKGYVETSPQTTFLAPWILKSIPNAKFIHLMRDPLDVVRSGMRRKWYEGIQSDATRIRPRADSQFHKEWEGLSTLQRNIWLWAETNRWITEFCQTLPNKQTLFLRSEEIFGNHPDRINALFTFVGTAVPAQHKIHGVLNKQLNKQTMGEFSKDGLLEGCGHDALNAFVAGVARKAGYQWPV